MIQFIQPRSGSQFFNIVNTNSSQEQWSGRRKLLEGIQTGNHATGQAGAIGSDLVEEPQPHLARHSSPT